MDVTEAQLWVGPKAVGGYDLGSVRLMVTRRPNWFQRAMARWFFGWIWNDA